MFPSRRRNCATLLRFPPAAAYCPADPLHARVRDARGSHSLCPHVVAQPASLCCVNAAAQPDPLRSSAPPFHVIQRGAAADARMPLSTTPAPLSSSTEAHLALVGAFLLRLKTAVVRSPALAAEGYCFFHRRLGEGAQNCRPPFT